MFELPNFSDTILNISSKLIMNLFGFTVYYFSFDFMYGWSENFN